MNAVLLFAILASPKVTDKTGFYATLSKKVYELSGKLKTTSSEEMLLPNGSFLGVRGHSYGRIACDGRELFLERDEKTYNNWWSAPTVGKAGRDFMNSPDAIKARQEQMGDLTLGARSVSHSKLPSKKAYGLTFEGEKIVFNDGTWSKEWSRTIAGQGLILYSESQRKDGRTVERLTILRRPSAADLKRLSISAKHPNLPSDSRGMLQAFKWIYTGKWPAAKKS